MKLNLIWRFFASCKIGWGLLQLASLLSYLRRVQKGGFLESGDKARMAVPDGKKNGILFSFLFWEYRKMNYSIWRSNEEVMGFWTLFVSDDFSLAYSQLFDSSLISPGVSNIEVRNPPEVVIKKFKGKLWEKKIITSFRGGKKEWRKNWKFKYIFLINYKNTPIK